MGAESKPETHPQLSGSLSMSRTVRPCVQLPTLHHLHPGESGPWSECCKEAQARGQRGAGRLPAVHQPCSAQWAQCPVIVPEPPFALTAKLGTQEDGIQGYEVPRQKAKWVVSTFLCFTGLGTSDSSLNLPGSQSPVYKMGIKMANP